ncbi:hypothetical protein [Paraburkholderia rhynchosiae]|uniref:MmcQ/YjbR family DNA-binding protein n=1 Tax=Paraburkholderia rhynchosiae TaxID=487049 RepID=A0A2N7WBK5_9BURK|nr:hypothetical protein [Paraburkholderia rhynchosiae]PMS26792.1 hypothetical protein C0Z16_26300 [Paraburkholderia rhynchosiae]CAB3727879.1 hypothetical protein LMG27174_05522 [Paraburkholderia rhynchosiae]
MGSTVKNSLLWVFEPIEDDPGFMRRRLFGFEAAYVDGLLCLAVGNGEEPWNGLLVCTSRDRQADITSEFPELAPHPVLGKWLYLSQKEEEFETVAAALVKLVRRRDLRVGVEPSAKKKPAKKAIGK